MKEDYVQIYYTYTSVGHWFIVTYLPYRFYNQIWGEGHIL